MPTAEPPGVSTPKRANVDLESLHSLGGGQLARTATQAAVDRG